MVLELREQDRGPCDSTWPSLQHQRSVPLGKWSFRTTLKDEKDLARREWVGRTFQTEGAAHTSEGKKYINNWKRTSAAGNQKARRSPKDSEKMW